jgi:hypothetical protein
MANGENAAQPKVEAPKEKSSRMLMQEFLSALKSGQVVVATDLSKKVGLKGANFYAAIKKFQDAKLINVEKKDGRVYLVRA